MIGSGPQAKRGDGYSFFVAPPLPLPLCRSRLVPHPLSMPVTLLLCQHIEATKEKRQRKGDKGKATKEGQQRKGDKGKATEFDPGSLQQLRRRSSGLPDTFFGVGRLLSLLVTSVKTRALPPHAFRAFVNSERSGARDVPARSAFDAGGALRILPLSVAASWLLRGGDVPRSDCQEFCVNH